MFETNIRGKAED